MVDPLVIATLLVFGFASAGTGLVRLFILRRAARSADGSAPLMDAPNHRSSHQAATPRGGGIAIVCAFLPAAAWLAWRGASASPFAVGLLAGAALVALTGFLDDLGGGLPAKPRLVAHFGAAALFLFLAGGAPGGTVWGLHLGPGWAANLLAALYLVWMLNLFNFMDGIDGIAAGEAVTAGLGGAFVWYLAAGTGHWGFAVLLAAAAAGFLVWNHPPARIFMGDAGSCFLGFGLGALALWAGAQAPQLFWAWTILLGCFIVDATTTLARRLLRGKRFDEAHRSHAYQYASRRYASHRRVTWAYALVNLLWLLPVASAVALNRLDGATGVLVAYAPLLLLALRFKAGAPELQGP